MGLTTRRNEGSTKGARTSAAGRALALIVACAVILVGAGCTNAASSPTTTSASPTGIVTQPELELQGCTYTVNSSIPTGEATGINPGFPAFAPNGAADRALRQIKTHGGTAMVDGVTLPAGTKLYAGPDTTQPSVGRVASGNSVQVAEPVVDIDHSGKTWLAFFLACGGGNLYWLSVDQLRHDNPSIGADLMTLIQQLGTAPPYTQSNSASMLPIKVDNDRHLVWAVPGVHFVVGRGEIANVP